MKTDNIHRLLLTAIALLLLASCGKKGMRNDVVVENDHFIVGIDTVQEGKMLALAQSETHITSTYVDPTGTLSQSPSWQVNYVPPGYPVYQSRQRLVDALYNMALSNIAVAGNDWSGATDARMTDAIALSLACVDAAQSQNVLMGMVHDGVVGDKTSPLVTDCLSWGAAAWEVYCLNGDRQWLRTVYDVLLATLQKQRWAFFDENINLLRGISATASDHRTTPQWMKGSFAYDVMTLRNNVLLYKTYLVLADIADELHIGASYEQQAQQIKDAINQNFWNESLGRYAELLYGDVFPLVSPTTDNMAQALAVLYDIADDGRSVKLMEETPISDYGVPSRYPVVSGRRHASDIDLLTEGYWTCAAASTGNEIMLRRTMGAMYRSQAMFCRNDLAVDLATGAPVKSVEASSLTGAAANLALIYRVIAGMKFLPNGIEFAPVVPVCFYGEKEIRRFAYRDAVLRIRIKGTGTGIKSMKIDGHAVEDNFLSSTVTGEHTVEIEMDGVHNDDGEVTLADLDSRLPAAPRVTWHATYGINADYTDMLSYKLVINGTRSYSVSSERVALYPRSEGVTITQLAAVSKYGFGFVSEPHVEFVRQTKASVADDGCATFTVPEAGWYVIQADCSHHAAKGIAVMKVFVNTHPQGTLVAADDSDGGMKSNLVAVQLLKGRNVLHFAPIEAFTTADAKVKEIRIAKK